MRQSLSTTDGPLRALVVGAGRIAEQHLSALDALPHADVAGLCDPSTTLAQHAAARFGGAVYRDVEQALAQERPDVVHVLTPAHLHVRVAQAALDAGAHVLVEKPMALDAVGREQLLVSAQAAGRVLVEDHNYRFNRPMVALQHAVASGALGRLMDVEVTVAMPLQEGNRYHDRNLPSPSHALPAGFIHEFITHMAYLASSLAPDLQVRDARWAKRVPSHGSRYDEFHAALESPLVTGRLRFTSVAPRAEISVTATGTEGRASAEMIFGAYRVSRPRPGGQQLGPSVDALVDGLRSVRRSAGYVTDRLRGRSAYEGLHEFVRRTYGAVADGGPPPVTPADMRAAGRLVDELMETLPCE